MTEFSTTIESTTDREAVERLRSIPADTGSYAESIAEIYIHGPQSKGQFYTDLQTVLEALSKAEQRAEDAEDCVEELEHDAEIVSSEFEKDCWVAMRSLLLSVGFNDFSEPLSAEDAREIIAEAIDNLSREAQLATSLLQDWVDKEVDYMTRNNLGDPEKQQIVIASRAFISLNPA